MRSLTDMKQGTRCTVKWMFCLPEVLEFMHRYHIEQGSQIWVIQKEHGGMVIGTEDTRIALSREVTDRIKV